MTKTSLELSKKYYYKGGGFRKIEPNYYWSFYKEDKDLEKVEIREHCKFNKNNKYKYEKEEK